MALSKISELGGQVILGDYSDETIIPAIADGTAKAGWLVGLTTAGIVAGADTDSPDAAIGLLLPHYLIDVDGAITSPYPVSVVIPKGGHLYAVFVADMNSSLVGLPMNVGGDAGKFVVVATVEGTHLCKSYSYTDGDTVAIVIWGS